MKFTKFNNHIKYAKNLLLLNLTILFTILIITCNVLCQNSGVANASNTSELYEKLCKLDGVHDVKPISTEKFQEKYLFEITQPLDWDNPNGEKIEQRVIISFNGFDKYNVIETEGYELKARVLTGDWSDEFVSKYSVNQINIEHRFFGESIPKGLDNKNPAKWQYLTTEYAAKDTHKIYTELAKILPNKWIASGASKGGETTMLYGYYFPEDMDIYVPYVAPWSIPNDPRAFDFIWNRAGNERYGIEQATEYRELMDDIMLDFYTHRDDVRERFLNERAKNIYYVEDYYGHERSAKILYDQLVLDLPFGTWQYDQEFEKIQNIHNMSWDTEHDAKVEELLNLISDPETNKLLKNRMMINTNGEDVDYPHYAYEFQAWREQGNYYFDMQHLRDLIKNNNIETGLEIKDGEEVDLFAHLFVHKNLMDAYPYISKTHDGLIQWWNSTNQKIMAIYGSSDPWYALRINDVYDKDNIKIFVSNKEAHGAKINNLADADTTQAWSILDTWLAENPVNPPDNPQNPGEITQTAATGDSVFYAILFVEFALLISLIIFTKRMFSSRR